MELYYACPKKSKFYQRHFPPLKNTIIDGESKESEDLSKVLLDDDGIGNKHMHYTTQMKSVIQFATGTFLRYSNEGDDIGNEEPSLIQEDMDDTLSMYTFKDTITMDEKQQIPFEDICFTFILNYIQEIK